MALTDNLAAYWKLDEASGNPADATGNGYTLTNTGTTTFAAGKINNGAEFGSANSTKYLAYSAGKIGNWTGGDMTISGWVKIETAPTTGITQEIFEVIDNTTNFHNAEFQYQNNGGTLQINMTYGQLNVAGQNKVYTQTLTIGTWYHIVYTIASAAATLYLNGSSVATQTWTNTGNGSVVGGTWTSGFYTGAHTDSGNRNWLSGMTDEIGFWTRAITSTEVTTLYNAGAGFQYPFLASTQVGYRSLLGVGI